MFFWCSLVFLLLFLDLQIQKNLGNFCFLILPCQVKEEKQKISSVSLAFQDPRPTKTRECFVF